MSIGGFSMLVDGYSKGLHDSIAYEDALDRTVHNQLANNYVAAVQPLMYEQEDARAANAVLGARYNADQYGLYRLGYPGQQALQAIGSLFAPQLGFNNSWLQLMQQGALMANPAFFTGMQDRMPSTAFGGYYG